MANGMSTNASMIFMGRFIERGSPFPSLTRRNLQKTLNTVILHLFCDNATRGDNIKRIPVWRICQQIGEYEGVKGTNGRWNVAAMR
jgi:hypothetical protein